MSGKRPRGRPPHPDILTPTEWKVAHFVRHGLSNRRIAARFGVSLDAIKYHVANIVGKIGAENRAALRTWRGAPADSALAALAERSRPMDSIKDRSTIAESPSVPEWDDARMGPIGQIARSVEDVHASVVWYRDVVGLRHLYTFGNLAFFDCDGLRLMLEGAEGAEGAGPTSLLYFRVADINRSYDELTERGVNFISAPHLVHRHEDGLEEWMAFFEDLEDRPLAIMAQSSKV